MVQQIMRIHFTRHHLIGILVVIAALFLLIPYLSHRDFEPFRFYNVVIIPEKQTVPFPSLAALNAPSPTVVGASNSEFAGWVLLVRVYKSAVLAEKEAASLRARHLPAYVDQNKASEFQVMLGPVSTETELEQLKKSSGINGIDLKFNPFLILSALTT